MMDISATIKMLEESSGNNAYEVTVPSSGITTQMRPMTVGMRKSIAKLSLSDDKIDQIKFQMAKLALIKTLDLKNIIDINNISEGDFISIICQIMENNLMDDFVLKIPCNKCAAMNLEKVDFQTIIKKCQDIKAEEYQYSKTIKNVKYDFSIRAPRIVDILSIESMDIEDFSMKDKTVIYPFLYVNSIKINEAEVDFSNNNSETSTLHNRIDVLDALPASIITGTNSLIEFIVEKYKTYNTQLHDLMPSVKCSKCNAEFGSVVTTDSFFIF